MSDQEYRFRPILPAVRARVLELLTTTTLKFVDIAAECGCSADSVSKINAQSGLPRKARGTGGKGGRKSGNQYTTQAERRAARPPAPQKTETEIRIRCAAVALSNWPSTRRLAV